MSLAEIALKKYAKMDAGSFVPHRGVMIRHKDGSSMTLTGSFMEKYRANAQCYYIVYTKNSGVLTYAQDDLDSIHEFIISVPTTLMHIAPKKKTWGDRVIEWIKQCE